MCNVAHRSHLVCPSLGGFGHSRHLVGSPARIFACRAMLRASSRSALFAASLLVSWIRLALLCSSAQGSHLVCLGMVGSPQCLHSPYALARASFSLNRVLCFSALASGVSGILVCLGALGGFASLKVSSLGLLSLRAILPFLVLPFCSELRFFSLLSIWKECSVKYPFARLIPASAGEPGGISPTAPWWRVYPRECGRTAWRRRLTKQAGSDAAPAMVPRDPGSTTGLPWR